MRKAISYDVLPHPVISRITDFSAEINTDPVAVERIHEFGSIARD